MVADCRPPAHRGRQLDGPAEPSAGVHRPVALDRPTVALPAEPGRQRLTYNLNAMLDFATAIDDIKSTFQRLVEMDPFCLSTRPSPVPKGQAGVYILYESDRPLYVGRGRDLRKRLANHRSTSVTAATLAVKMARIAAKTPTTYTPTHKAANLLKTNPAFKAEFERATTRIRAMQVRYVAIEDDVRQALLEIYAASTLSTLTRCGGYNTFETS